MSSLNSIDWHERRIARRAWLQGFAAGWVAAMGAAILYMVMR